MKFTKWFVRITLYVILLYIEARLLDFAAMLLNQPSDLAVVGGIGLIASTLFVVVMQTMIIFNIRRKS